MQVGLIGTLDERTASWAMASPQATQPPWCFLLAEHLHFGAVDWWAPSDMLRLRATCGALRGLSNTSAYLLAILAEGLGWSRYAIGVELAEHSLRELFFFCSRLYSERLLLCSLPQAVRQAAGVSDSIDATPYAIMGGSFALHRYLLRSDDPDRRPRWEPDDLDVFIPFGCAHDSPAEEVAPGATPQRKYGWFCHTCGGDASMALTVYHTDRPGTAGGRWREILG